MNEVSLYHNISGAWQLNQTRSTSGREVSPTFNVTGLTDGSYRWNCLAYDNSSQSVCGENRTTDVGIGVEMEYEFPRTVVNNGNASYFIFITYNQYLNNLLNLGNFSVVELDDNQVYFSQNISNNTGFLVNGLSFHAISIRLVLNDIFDNNFTIGNRVNLNITIDYYYAGTTYRTYRNTSIEITN